MSVVVLRHSGYWGRELIDSETDLILIDLRDATLSEDAERRYSRTYRIESWGDLTALGRIAGDLLDGDVTVDMIYSPTEFTQGAAGHLRAALSPTPNPVSVVLATRDKRVMKQLANRAGVRTTTWRTVHADTLEADTTAVATEIGFPVVAKPVDGFGTMDTDVIRSADELAAYAQRMLVGDPASGADMFVCEAFVEGDEFHADGVFDDGELVSFLLSRYHVSPRDLRAGHGPDLSIALNEGHHPEVYAAARAALTGFASEAGLESGPFHFEFFAGSAQPNWAQDGVVFSEIASRIGGGNIGDMVGAWTGVNLRDQTVAQGLGVLGQATWKPSDYPVLGLLNLVPSASGTFVTLPHPEQLAAEPDVLFVSVPAQIGDRFEVGVSSALWTAVVVVGAESEDALVARCEALAHDHPVVVQ